MDPNSTLAEIRALTSDILAGKYAVGDDPSYELAERLEALDGWLKGGGFMPKDWHASFEAEYRAREQASRDKANGYDRETGTYYSGLR